MRRSLTLLLTAALLLSPISLCSCVGPIAAILAAMDTHPDDDDKYIPVTLRVPVDYATIQNAIDAANSGDTVLVADGTYTGFGNKDLDFWGESIVLKSENGPSACIIDCESSGRGFYFHSGETNAAIVEGFTIQNGSADDGGALYCENSSPKIVNCILTNNVAANDGGAVWCKGYANAKIENCTIRNNSASDSGGGIYCWNQSDVLVVTCVIADNSANRGAAIACDGQSKPKIKNCLISGNSATDRGGAVWIIHGNPTFTNCTIADNTATSRGGALDCDGTYDPLPTFNNSILWGNSAGGNGDQLYLDGASVATLNHCDYDNGAGDISGSGSVNANSCTNLDPQFVDALNSDYHLQSGSPCIDKGNNAYVTWSEDLDRNPRILNTVDIGAYEYQTEYIVVDLTTGALTGIATIPDLLTNDAYKTTKLVLKRIPAGTFQMGDQAGGGDADELPVHTVNITQAFYIGVFEVTQRQWYEIQGDWPSYFTTNPDKRPVEKVSWDNINGAGGFMESLASLTGDTFRLPTEAEWEYCCKAGTTTNYSYGDTADGAYMWYDVNGGGETHEVGGKLPNPWGLYDMHGNVWEWCEDWYDSGYYQYCVDNTITDDPQGPAGPLTYRVMRDSGWDSVAWHCRSAARREYWPSDRLNSGLRVSRSSP